MSYEQILEATGLDDLLPADGSLNAHVDSFIPQHGGQYTFMRSPYFEVLLEGNRGGGKTDILIMDFAQHLGTSAEPAWGRAWRGLLLRRTYKELTDVINKTLTYFPIIFPGARYNASDHIWTFEMGETLRLGYAERPADYWGYHGSEYPWIGFEELSNWATPDVYLRFVSLNRSKVPGMPRKYRATTNPFGPGHGWIKLRWSLPAMRNIPIIDKTGREKTRVAIQVKLNENLVLLKAEPDYVQKVRMSASSPGMLAAWEDGDWNIVEGGMFSDVFSERWNVVEDFVPPSSWLVDRSFDDGSSAPFSVGWWAQSDGTDLTFKDGRVMSTLRGDLFRWREWYGWTGQPNTGLKYTSAEISTGIVARELRFEIPRSRINSGPADSSIFARTHGICIAEEMAVMVTIDSKRYRGPEFSPADKTPGSRVAGWRQIRNMLKAAHPDIRGKRETPGLFICRGCVNWLRVVPIMTRDEANPEDVDFAEDHLGDETRYRVHNPPRLLTSVPNEGRPKR